MTIDNLADPTRHEMLLAAMEAVQAQEDLAQTIIHGMNEWVAQYVGSQVNDANRLKAALMRKGKSIIKEMDGYGETVASAMILGAREQVQNLTNEMAPVAAVIPPIPAPHPQVPQAQTQSAPQAPTPQTQFTCANQINPFNPCCPFDEETLTGQPPATPVPPGYCWVPKGDGGQGGILWTCAPCITSNGPVGTGGGGVVGGGVVTPTGYTCPPGKVLVTTQHGPMFGPPSPCDPNGQPRYDCDVVWTAGDSGPTIWCCPEDIQCGITGGGVIGGGTGGNGGAGGGGPIGGGVVGGNGNGVPAPTEPPKPCELPPDVANWPGMRIVKLPYDLSAEGEKSASSECGKLMLEDALSTVWPVSFFLDMLNAPDPWAAMDPWDEGYLEG
jgi:hypothetical protein